MVQLPCSHHCAGSRWVVPADDQVWFHEAGTPQKADHCPNGEGYLDVESLAMKKWQGLGRTLNDSSLLGGCFGESKNPFWSKAKTEDPLLGGLSWQAA